MALEYRLTLAGSTPVNVVAERALPEADERPVGTAPLLSAALFQSHGFNVTVRAGQNGLVDVESDDGSWEWEPEKYVSLTFRMDKSADAGWNVVNMLTVVRQVLNTGDEDAALVLNGDILLLTRFDGTLAKHRRSWWEHYPGADEVVAG